MGYKEQNMQWLHFNLSGGYRTGGFARLPESVLKEINSKFTPYIFYENGTYNEFPYCSETKEEYKIFHCSNCGAVWTNIMPGNIHKQYGDCPECLESAKYINMSRGVKGLTETARLNVFFSPEPETVIYTAFMAEKRYYDIDELNNNEECLTTDRLDIYYPKYYAILEAGKITASKYMICWGGGIDTYNCDNKVTNPWAGSFQYSADPYTITDESLKDSFMKYSAYELIDRYILAKYLQSYALYPQLEFLAKMNLMSIVDEIINGRLHKRIFDYSAKNPKQFFKTLSTEEIRQLHTFSETVKAEHYGRQLNLCDLIDRYSYAKKRIKIKNMDEFFKAFYAERGYLEDKIFKILIKYNIAPSKYLKYMNNQKKRKIDVNASTFYDYYYAAEKLNYDLSQEIVKFPKDLRKAHDIAQKLVRQNEDKIKYEQYQKRYTKLKKMYEYEDDNFCIVIPTGTNEIIQEGQKLRHCVASYANRHMSGQTTIVFIREKDDINTPLYTVEVDDKTKNVRQAYGYKDTRITEESAAAFMNSWKEYIKHPKKRKAKSETAA